VEVHEAVGEHLAVNPVVAAVTFGEQLSDHARDTADAGLERRAVGNEAAHVLGDGAIAGAGLRVGQRRGRAIALDDDVDFVGRERVWMLGGQARGARKVGVRLDDEQALGVAAAAVELFHCSAGVKREAEAAVGVGGCGGGDHHARTHFLDQSREAAKVAGDVVHVVARCLQCPLHRAIEAA